MGSDDEDDELSQLRAQRAARIGGPASLVRQQTGILLRFPPHMTYRLKSVFRRA